jgi:hypothetical protein
MFKPIFQLLEKMTAMLKLRSVLGRRLSSHCRPDKHPSSIVRNCIG